MAGLVGCQQDVQDSTGSLQTEILCPRHVPLPFRRGTPCRTLEKADPDVTLSAEDREIGGLGIFLCKKLMDKIDYKYEDGCNVLTMSKKIVQ